MDTPIRPDQPELPTDMDQLMAFLQKMHSDTQEMWRSQNDMDRRISIFFENIKALQARTAPLEMTQQPPIAASSRNNYDRPVPREAQGTDQEDNFMRFNFHKESPKNSKEDRRESFYHTRQQDSTKASWLSEKFGHLHGATSDVSGNISRTIIQIDPSKCQVKLSKLTLQAVFSWFEDMRKLQNQHPYESLNWGIFISLNTVLAILAWDKVKKISG